MPAEGGSTPHVTGTERKCSLADTVLLTSLFQICVSDVCLSQSGLTTRIDTRAKGCRRMVSGPTSLCEGRPLSKATMLLCHKVVTVTSCQAYPL